MQSQATSASLPFEIRGAGTVTATVTLTPDMVSVAIAKPGMGSVTVLNASLSASLRPAVGRVGFTGATGAGSQLTLIDDVRISGTTPATNGGRPRIVLDFDGHILRKEQLTNQGWSSQDAAMIPFNRRGDYVIPSLAQSLSRRLRGQAGTIAQGVAQKVREDFAAYNVDVVVSMDVTGGNPLAVFDDNINGDIVLFIGGSDFIQDCTDNRGRNVANALGNTVVDPLTDGINADGIGFVFAGFTATIFSNISVLVNVIAASVSHEAGHAFGLSHVVPTSGDIPPDRSPIPMGQEIMAAPLILVPIKCSERRPPPGAVYEPRDPTRDFRFHTVGYRRDADGDGRPDADQRIQNSDAELRRILGVRA